MFLLIGSRALRAAGEKFISQSKRSWDTDFICTYENFERFKNKQPKPVRILPTSKGRHIALFTRDKNIYDFEIAWDGSTAQELLQLVKEHNLAKRVDDYKCYVADPDVIFTLKKSHRFLKDSPHFLKTMLDYRHLRDNCNCEVPEVLNEWYKKRVKETYWYKHPKLNMSKDNFFKDDGVPYVYDHDTIHLSMAHLEKPAYEYYKVENAEVQCSRELFEKCSEEIRLYGVVEEAYVLALERSQIPAPGAWTPRKSFEYALMKVCSSITSGYFRDYAYENYFEALKLYNDNYVNKFWQDVESGLVKKLNDTTKS